MKVKATQLGYHDHRRRRPGDVFVLRPIEKADGKIITPEQQFSKKWMEKVGESVPELNQKKPEIRPGNIDAVHDSQPKHSSLAQIQAESAGSQKDASEEKAPALASQSSGDQDLI